MHYRRSIRFMSFSSGPNMPTDDRGRTQAYGYLITGSETDGYRGRAAVPLTAEEVAYGCRELVFAETLVDLCALCRAELSMRSMVGQAAEAAHQDAVRARGDAALAGSAAGEVLDALAEDN